MKYVYVYLAGPMQGCTDGEANDWRNYIMTNMVDYVLHPSPQGPPIKIPKHRYYFLNPMARDYRHLVNDHEKLKAVCPEIIELDKRDIDRSDIVVANVFKQSAGTSMELLYAKERGKIIVVIVPKDQPLSAWVAYHSTHICYSLNEAIEWITSRVR